MSNNNNQDVNITAASSSQDIPPSMNLLYVGDDADGYSEDSHSVASTSNNNSRNTLRLRRPNSRQLDSPSSPSTPKGEGASLFLIPADGSAQGRSLPFSKPKTLEEKKNALNFLFGFKPWKGHITKRPLSQRSEVVKSLYMDHQINSTKGAQTMRALSLGNVIYSICFGWWLFILYLILSFVCYISIIGIPHGKLLYQLSFYYLWPFGRYVEYIGHRSYDPLDEAEKSALLRGTTAAEAGASTLIDEDVAQEKKPQTKRSSIYKYYQNIKKVSFKDAVEKLLFLIFIAPLLLIFHLIVIVTTWFTIIMIPTTKIHFQGLSLFFKLPNNLAVSDQFPPAPGSDILICSYQAVNVYYYKYNLFGANVILFNLLPMVGISLIMGYAIPHHYREMPEVAIPTFIVCLISTIPLAYYIGKAVSSISAQTSFAVGALLNASFGSIIELILYFISLSKGLHVVVQQALTGSLLSNILLMPGFAMIFGGIKHKEQYFNRNAAGVSSVLLLVAILGAFTPTLFYQIHGSYELSCNSCFNGTNPDGSGFKCSGCQYVEKDYSTDPVYIHKAKYLSYVCAAILPIAYIVGLLFSLKTHTHLYQETEEEKEHNQGGGHGEEEAPEWGTVKAIIILLAATGVFALVAEAMTDAMIPALDAIGVNEEFAGLTLLAVFPSVAEFSNAISFAMQNNITLSLEIGSVGSVQIALIQIPILVIFSALIFGGDVAKTFTLIFPQFDLFAIFFAVIVLNYVSIDGRCNYFEGTSLVLVYLVIVCSFFFSYQI